ncbi:MAG: hypothetical protein QME32_01345 [Endomicrobiia bacterium]|nr:hypothetical protein [Endomicrobiia bacterium]
MKCIPPLRQEMSADHDKPSRDNFSRPLVFISAGDHSAENHAVRVAALLKEGGASVSSVGGAKLKSLSDVFVGDTVALETFGFSVPVRSALGLLKIYRAVERHLDEARPAAALLVDFFGFNAKVGAAASRRGIPVYYYIPPQVWATRYSRINAIKTFARKVFITLPFEREIYEKEGIAFESVGHPLLEAIPFPSASSQRPPSSPPLVGFFPGSRTHVVKRHVGILNAVAALLVNKYGRGKIDFALFGLSSLKDSYGALAPGIKLILDAGSDGIARSGLAAAASVSGTIATELSLMKVPTVIFYKVSGFNAFIVRSTIKTKYVSLPNILANEEIQPECLQEIARPENIAAHLAEFLGDVSDNKPTSAFSTLLKEKLSGIRRLLEPADASRRVASSILNDIRELLPVSVGRSNI